MPNAIFSICFEDSRNPGNPGTGKGIRAKPNLLQTEAESELSADLGAVLSLILFHYLSVF